MEAYSMDLRRRVIEAKQEGLSSIEVAQRFKMTPRTVDRYWKSFNENGHVEPGQQGGYTPESFRVWRSCLELDIGPALARTSALGSYFAAELMRSIIASSAGMGQADFFRTMMRISNFLSAERARVVDKTFLDTQVQFAGRVAVQGYDDDCHAIFGDREPDLFRDNLPLDELLRDREITTSIAIAGRMPFVIERGNAGDRFRVEGWRIRKGWYPILQTWGKEKIEMGTHPAEWGCYWKISTASEVQSWIEPETVVPGSP